MKSIKEQSLEVFPEHCNFYTNSSNEKKRIGFEAGANYALDEIEKLLPKEDKNLNDYGKALVWKIKDTIEQLKGNQIVEDGNKFL